MPSLALPNHANLLVFSVRDSDEFAVGLLAVALRPLEEELDVDVEALRAPSSLSFLAFLAPTVSAC